MITFLMSLISTLDSRTLLISTTLMASVMGFVILSQRKILPKSSIDSTLVGFSNLAIGCGSLLLGFRGESPLWLSLIVGNVFVVFGCSLLLVGLRKFDNLYAPLWWILVAPLIVLLVFLVTDVYGIYVLVINFLMVCLTFGIVWSLLTSSVLTGHRLIIVVVIGLCGVLAIGRMWNGIIYLMQDNLLSSPLSLVNGSSSSAQLLLSANLITVLLWSIGFMLMKNDKVSANLVKLATHDQMTQALTRSSFMVLAEDLYRNSKNKNSCGAILMLDLDNFKKINDTYGHQMGDAVLIMFAKNIIKNIRSGDIFARYGGEEFIIFLPETDKKNAIKIAECIRKITSDNPILTDKGYCNVTVSIGVSSFCDTDIKLDVLINSADKALYLAKNTGRNKVCEDSLVQIE